MKWPASDEVLDTGDRRRPPWNISVSISEAGKAKCAFATASARLLRKRRCRTDQLGRYLGKRAPGRVVLETCTEAFRIAGGARQQGHDVRVVAATLVRSLGVGQRGTEERSAGCAGPERSLVSHRVALGPHSFSRQSRGQGHLCVTRGLDQDPDAVGESRTELRAVSSRRPPPSHTGELSQARSDAHCWRMPKGSLRTWIASSRCLRC